VLRNNDPGHLPVSVGLSASVPSPWALTLPVCASPKYTKTFVFDPNPRPCNELSPCL
jgi:hypothetical protein